MDCSTVSTLASLVSDMSRAGLQHHRYRIVIRLWVSYTPTNDQQRNIGLYGLHFN